MTRKYWVLKETQKCMKIPHSLSVENAWQQDDPGKLERMNCPVQVTKVVDE